MYAKLVDGNIIVAPNHIETDELHIYNPSKEQYAEQGYKPVRYTNMPEAQEGYSYQAGWEETDDEIVQTWTQEPLPDDIDETGAFNIIFGGAE